MRNPVAKNDFNRAAIHPDKKKDDAPKIQEGLDELYQEKDPEYIAFNEYTERVKATKIFSHQSIDNV